MFKKYQYIKSILFLLCVYCMEVGASCDDNLPDCHLMKQICTNLRDCKSLEYSISTTATQEIKNIINDQKPYCEILYQNENGLMQDNISWEGRCFIICERVFHLSGCKGSCGQPPEFPKPF